MEEKKVYPVMGNVTISTEEYRDLIERCKDLELENKRLDNRYYEKYREVDDVKRELAAKDEAITGLMAYKKFVLENYKAEYKLSQIECDTEEED